MIQDRDLLAEMPPIKDEVDWYEWFENLSPAEKAEVKGIAEILPRVGPIEGPQRMAFNSPADVTGYGGAAGGGKTALIGLLSILSHERSVVYRHDAKQLRGLIDDLVDFCGSDTGLNRQQGVFYFGDRPNHMIEWGGLGNPGSEMQWRGRPHDLFAADEVTELNLKKLMFLMTWLRTVAKGQRCRALFTFNPPGSIDEITGSVPPGRWVIPFFAPWLDERHENPAAPGELRYFITNEEGESEEVDSAEPREMTLQGRTFTLIPRSRTFIPANVQDNPYLTGTGYEQQLLGLEEPFRSQMLLGDFRSGIVDHPSQVLPTKWVDDAMERWQPDGGKDVPMSALGVDVARGGRDNTVLSRRHHWWFDRLLRHKGTDTPDGPAVAAHCIAAVRDGAPINIDASSWGASAYDQLATSNAYVNGVIAQRRKGLRQLTEKIKPFNLRAWLYWCARLLLDPSRRFLVALPPDNRLRSDLISPTFRLVEGAQILIESKDDLRDRLGRSTDDGDAVVNSLYNALSEPDSDRLLPSQGDHREDRGAIMPGRRPDMSSNKWMLM